MTHLRAPVLWDLLVLAFSTQIAFATNRCLEYTKGIVPPASPKLLAERGYIAELGHVLAGPQGNFYLRSKPGLSEIERLLNTAYGHMNSRLDRAQGSVDDTATALANANSDMAALGPILNKLPEISEKRMDLMTDYAERMVFLRMDYEKALRKFFLNNDPQTKAKYPDNRADRLPESELLLDRGNFAEVARFVSLHFDQQKKSPLRDKPELKKAFLEFCAKFLIRERARISQNLKVSANEQRGIKVNHDLPKDASKIVQSPIDPRKEATTLEDVFSQELLKEIVAYREMDPTLRKKLDDIFDINPN